MGNLAGTDPAIRQADIESLKQWFYTASAVNSPAIQINTRYADGSDAPNRFVDAYQELADVGPQAGVRLLMENHDGLSAHSNGLSEILARLDSEDGMRPLVLHAFSCHVKVFNHSSDGQHSWDRQAKMEMCDRTI